MDDRDNSKKSKLTSDETPSVMVKWHFEGRWRRFHCVPWTFAALIAKIRAIAPQFRGELLYRDSDGDPIWFNSDDEMRSMLKYFRDELKTSTVRLETMNAPNAEQQQQAEFTFADPPVQRGPQAAAQLVETAAADHTTSNPNPDEVMELEATKYSPEKLNSLISENGKLQITLSQKENEVQLLKNECERLGDEMSKQKNNLATTTAELKAMKEANEKATTDLKSVRAFALKYRSERNVQEEEISKLKASMKEKDEELARLRQSAIHVVGGQGHFGAASLQRRLQELTKEKQDLLEKVKQLETTHQSDLHKMEELEARAATTGKATTFATAATSNISSASRSHVSESKPKTFWGNGTPANATTVTNTASALHANAPHGRTTTATSATTSIAFAMSAPAFTTTTTASSAMQSTTAFGNATLTAATASVPPTATGLQFTVPPPATGFYYGAPPILSTASAASQFRFQFANFPTPMANVSGSNTNGFQFSTDASSVEVNQSGNTVPYQQSQQMQQQRSSGQSDTTALLGGPPGHVAPPPGLGMPTAHTQTPYMQQANLQSLFQMPTYHPYHQHHQYMMSNANRLQSAQRPTQTSPPKGAGPMQRRGNEPQGYSSAGSGQQDSAGGDQHSGGGGGGPPPQYKKKNNAYNKYRSYM